METVVILSDAASFSISLFQIRKMMATIIAAAEGSINKRDVYEMITIPSKHSWIPFIGPAPPHGLYLANVEYPDRLFESDLDVGIVPGSNVSLSEELEIA